MLVLNVGAVVAVEVLALVLVLMLVGIVVVVVVVIILLFVFVVSPLLAVWLLWVLLLRGVWWCVCCWIGVGGGVMIAVVVRAGMSNSSSSPLTTSITPVHLQLLCPPFEDKMLGIRAGDILPWKCGLSFTFRTPPR